VCFRISPEEKVRFKEAAAKDGKSLGTWLKHLARQRIAEQNSA
jgi:predicted HicB family RNase H-like nuclease